MMVTFIVGGFIGAIVGFSVAAIISVAGNDRRNEEDSYLENHAKNNDDLW